jgi:hypothetical protein
MPAGYMPPLQLARSKIAIGQVEIGRPGVFGLTRLFPGSCDRSGAGVLSHGPAKSDTDVDAHAAMVAGVMVAVTKPCQEWHQRHGSIPQRQAHL